jgi:predicted DNA-binding ribbon-helix-helix protein
LRNRAERRSMKRSNLHPRSMTRLLRKHLILCKRRNHWQIVCDHLIATPPDDRIGDLAEASRQLNDVCGQLVALDRVLGIRSGSRETKSQIVKRCIVIGGRKTNVSLEDEFWSLFKEVADQRGLTVSQLATQIRARRTKGSVSSVIRLFVLGLNQERLSELQK